jgi:hypothetical protein
MPKSKSKKRRRSSSESAKLQFGGYYPVAKKRRDYLIMGILGVLAIGAIGAYWSWSSSAAQSFSSLAAEGQAALQRVDAEISRGQRHLSPGESFAYADRFPLSGPHHRTPTRPGFYETPQRPIQLVHAIEHGHIVVYYDQPDETTVSEMKRWVGLYSGRWAGVVVTPMPDLGRSIVLTAWTKRLTLDRFDAASAAAFIDAYRGRGPENRVR